MIKSFFIVGVLIGLISGLLVATIIVYLSIKSEERSKDD